MGELVKESARRREWYLDRLRRQHRGLIRAIKGGMLLAYPDLGDPKKFPEIR